MSVSLISGCKLDFSSCAIRAGFHKSSHIIMYCVYIATYVDAIYIRIRTYVHICRLQKYVNELVLLANQLPYENKYTYHASPQWMIICVCTFQLLLISCQHRIFIEKVYLQWSTVLQFIYHKLI